MNDYAYTIGSQVTLSDLEHEVYSVLHRLREHEPVSWLPVLNAWLVTRYDLAVAIMRDAKTFTVDHPGFSTAQVVGSSMLSLDGEQHQQHRTPFEQPFRKREVETRFEGKVAGYVDQLLTDLLPTGVAELRRDYAGPIAVQTMMAALGLNQVPAMKVLGWYDDIVASVTSVSAGEPASERGLVAFAALRENLLPTLWREPETSLLAAAYRTTSHLSEEAIIANAAVLLFGGIETTEGMIANVFFHLLTHPEVLRAVREQFSLIPAVVEESLRLEPAAAVVDRYAVADVRLGAAAIKAGELVRVSLLGANRDPAVFPNPDQFDPWRPNLRSHVTFAQGPHVCLGLHLARLEAQLAVAEVIRRLPELRLLPTEEAQEAARPRGLIFRKPQALHVTWQTSHQLAA